METRTPGVPTKIAKRARAKTAGEKEEGNRQVTGASENKVLKLTETTLTWDSEADLKTQDR
jgi:hypothetical protein